MEYYRIKTIVERFFTKEEPVLKIGILQTATENNHMEIKETCD